MSELVAKEKEVTLLDLLDRILDKGVILFGDVTISVADVDLIYLGLKVLLTSIEKAEKMRSMAAAEYSRHSTLKVQRETSSVKRET
jgi:hypothetical protein